MQACFLGRWTIPSDARGLSGTRQPIVDLESQPMSMTELDALSIEVLKSARGDAGWNLSKEECGRVGPRARRSRRRCDANARVDGGRR
ncbi:hypothetical protein RPD_1363 [Rhodopseudomonas palustris BisB5]|uniref:Uncharacterized protein n=1 Tax=Rhodopseudomonas palustris (strain BisB5) TaxID=316057 RepID=Q13BD8_RHOPS|nr:hypothetical protein RPD_1363 [Rhodopseudomonas palustris BisB5]